MRGRPSSRGALEAYMFAEPVDQYLRNFQWNKVKYRADKSIADLIDSLQKVGSHCTTIAPLSLWCL